MYITYIHMYIHVYTYMCINVYIYAYTHIYLRSDLEGRCSTAAIDLVKRCLTRDPIARITAQVLHAYAYLRMNIYVYVFV